jgi:quercetin dioxygenase-like cupin family protein
MPTPQPATVHRWTDRPTDTPMPLLQRQRIIGEQAMISRVHLHKGCYVPTHAHANEQFGIILRGRLKFGLGADNSPLRIYQTVGEGEVIHLPANLPHSAEALEDTLILDIFSPPSETTGIDRH